MPHVNLLHISDLHISKNPHLRQLQRQTPGNFYDAVRKGIYGASHGNGMLKALVELVYQKRSSLDGVVVTGDIATTGMDYDLEMALRFIEGRPDAHNVRASSGFPTISGAGLPVFLLPGNHDRYKLLLRSLGYAPGNRKFHQMFKGHWQGDVQRNSIVKDDFVVGVIAADFSLRKWQDAEGKGPDQVANSYAQGRVYPDILDELVDTTDAFRADHAAASNIFIIWAVHFPPVSTNSQSHMKLIDGEKLIEAANNREVGLILSGHTHDPFELSSPRMTFRALGTGSTTQFDSPEGNYCQIVSVESSANGCWVETEHYTFDRPSSRFVRT
jgi:3',5'-cyclic AMP phosphodiesterase CpdA